MANPTTNYSFAMPTNTDLVKDLPADFDIFGQAVDDRIKALNPETTLGDLAYRSSTANVKTRLGLGTAGQVLQVNSGATAPEWATPAGGGAYTLISTTTLSGASVALTSIPQTYRNLQIVVEAFKPATSGSLLFMRFNQDSSANQHANSTGIFQGAYSFNQTGSQLTKAETANWNSVAIVDVYNYTSTTTRRKGMVWGIGSSASDENANFCIGYLPTTAISSLSFYADVGNMTSGTVYLYGVK
jgi:hypothetical protein